MTDVAAPAFGEILAANIRAARSRAGVNQEALAERMRDQGFSAWHAQTVGNVERAQRRVMAEEILGLAISLGVQMRTLMKPTDDDRFVAFPSGAVITGASVRRSVDGMNDGAVQWDGNKPVITLLP